MPLQDATQLAESFVIELVSTVVLLLLLTVVGNMIMWLVNKLRSERCPACDSKLHTEEFGHWDGSDEWKCHACKHYWSVKSN